jgi:hypothetical protein
MLNAAHPPVGGGLPTAAHYLAIGGHSAAAAPNYSKARKYAARWLQGGFKTKYVSLPANAKDPVELNNFKVGNHVVMVSKKRMLSNGKMNTKNTFYKKITIGRLAAVHKRRSSPHTNPVPWSTILRMKGSDIVFKDPLNRRSVYRRDIMNVKFV